MKKALFILFIILKISTVNTAYAEIDDETNRQLNLLNLESISKYADDIINEIFGTSSDDLIRNAIEGEQINIRQIFDFVFNKITYSLKTAIPMCASILLFAVLYSIVENFDTKNDGIKHFLRIIINGSVVLIMINAIKNCTELYVDSVDTISGFLGAFFPIISTLICVVEYSSSFYSPIINVLSNVISVIIRDGVSPLINICIILSIFGNFTDYIKLNELTKSFSSIVKWILGTVFTVFSTLTIGNGVIIKNKSVFSSLTKSSLSGIPILSKMIGSADMVSASSRIILSSMGSGALLIILLIVLIPTINLFAVSISLRLSAGIAESFADKKLINMLVSVSNSLLLYVSAIVGYGIIFAVTVLTTVNI